MVNQVFVICTINWYFLGFPSYFQSYSKTSGCTDCFCDLNISHSKFESFKVGTQTTQYALGYQPSPLKSTTTLFSGKPSLCKLSKPPFQAILPYTLDFREPLFREDPVKPSSFCKFVWRLNSPPVERFVSENCLYFLEKSKLTLYIFCVLCFCIPLNLLFFKHRTLISI